MYTLCTAFKLPCATLDVLQAILTTALCDAQKEDTQQQQQPQPHWAKQKRQQKNKIRDGQERERAHTYTPLHRHQLHTNGDIIVASAMLEIIQVHHWNWRAVYNVLSEQRFANEGANQSKHACMPVFFNFRFNFSFHVLFALRFSLDDASPSLLRQNSCPLSSLGAAVFVPFSPHFECLVCVSGFFVTYSSVLCVLFSVTFFSSLNFYFSIFISVLCALCIYIVILCSHLRDLRFLFTVQHSQYMR